MSDEVSKAGYWTDGELPPNVLVGAGSVITGPLAFKRFHSERKTALRVGSACTLDGVHFALGPGGLVEIGDFCCLTSVILLCEAEIKLGSYVAIGWNTTIADTDFHPLDPAQRVIDAIASSPDSKGLARPEILKRPVVIEDDVWIGPNVTILKGVVIGAGAFIEPGSVIVRDVPAGARIAGNPARVLGAD
jgi:acetyltransferase-like isoleucine patch superfamily enzyme